MTGGVVGIWYGDPAFCLEVKYEMQKHIINRAFMQIEGDISARTIYLGERRQFIKCPNRHTLRAKQARLDWRCLSMYLLNAKADDAEALVKQVLLEIYKTYIWMHLKTNHRWLYDCCWQDARRWKWLPAELETLLLTISYIGYEPWFFSGILKAIWLVSINNGLGNNDSVIA